MSIDVEAYYRKYGPMVLRRCRYLLKNEERALDAMQDVFVKLLAYRHSLNDIYPSSLLYRIATNVCLNLIRKSRVEPLPQEPDLLLEIAAVDDRAESRWMAAHFLDHLFKKERSSTRDMLVMLHVDGLTLEEVAGITGLSVSGVRKRVREFKAKTRETMKEHEHGRLYS